MTDVTCHFKAIPSAPNTPDGQLTLSNCDPPIANTETLGPWGVIWIVAFLVLLGLVGQYILHHINRNALAEMKTAAGHIIKKQQRHRVLKEAGA